MGLSPIAAAKPGLSILGILKYGSLAIFLLIFIINIGYKAIETKSLTPVIQEVGNNLLYSTLKISELSKSIIDNGGIYSPQNNFWDGIKYFLISFSSLFENLFLVFLWVSIFSWLIPYTGLSSADEKLKKLIFSLIIFFMFQIVVILITAGINHNINSFEQGISLMLIPFTCFIDLFRALPYILKPAHDIIKNTCINNMTCG